MASKVSIILNAQAPYITEKGLLKINVSVNRHIFGFVVNQQKAAAGKETTQRAFCETKAVWVVWPQDFGSISSKPKISLDFFVSFFSDGKKKRINSLILILFFLLPLPL